MTQNRTLTPKRCPFSWVTCTNDCAWFIEKYGCAIKALPAIAEAFEDGIMIESDKPFFDEEDDSDEY